MMTQEAPARAKATATPAPMPEELPVISAVRPWSGETPAVSVMFAAPFRTSDEDLGPADVDVDLLEIPIAVAPPPPMRESVFANSGRPSGSLSLMTTQSSFELSSETTFAVVMPVVMTLSSGSVRTDSQAQRAAVEATDVSPRSRASSAVASVVSSLSSDKTKLASLLIFISKALALAPSDLP